MWPPTRERRRTMTPENDRIAASYDDVPYVSMSFDFSAPESLRSVAWLFGVDAPDPGTARVLELGCASGGNLIPFAQRHPGAQAVGVDLSAGQVAEGNALITRLGLDNVRLARRDLASIDASFGQFDYIVCHGVYSWVPDEVRAAILRICRQNLAPQGIAFVSYNTYPGWKTREVVRDAMRFHGTPRGAPAQQLAHARGMLDFLRERAAGGELMERILATHSAEVAAADDYYLIHEYLELHNHPCYFRDFAEASQAQGLAYLGDSHVSTMFASNLGSEAAEALRAECADQVTLEQYMDFLRHRQFRKTLLVHAEREQDIQRTLDPARLRTLSYSGWFSEPREVEGAAGKRSYRTHRGARVELGGAVTHGIATLLTEAYPNALTGDELAAALVSRGLGDAPAVAAEVASVLGQLIAFNAVDFQRDSWPRAAASVAARPVAWPEARAWHARRFEAAGSGKSWVVAPNHETVVLDAAAQQLLPLLDGTRSQAQLGAALVVAHRKGELTLMRDGEHPRLEDGAELKACAREVVANTLEHLRMRRLLVP